MRGNNNKVKMINILTVTPKALRDAWQGPGPKNLFFFNFSYIVKFFTITVNIYDFTKKNVCENNSL